MPRSIVFSSLASGIVPIAEIIECLIPLHIKGQVAIVNYEISDKSRPFDYERDYGAGIFGLIAGLAKEGIYEECDITYRDSFNGFALGGVDIAALVEFNELIIKRVGIDSAIASDFLNLCDGEEIPELYEIVSRIAHAAIASSY